MTNLILVDEHDQIIWYEEKLRVHELGLLHRAFSIYLFDDQWRILLQQRAMTKYHAPWLRANTCCSHPFPDESNIDAAHRRLQEELWFDNTLSYLTEFIYQTPVPPDLIEHEYLHVFIGRYTGENINPDPSEVMATKRMPIDEFTNLVDTDDTSIAPWTKITRKRLKDEIIFHLQSDLVLP